MDKYSVLLNFLEEEERDKALEVLKDHKPIVNEKNLEFKFESRGAALDFIREYAATGYSMSLDKTAE